MHAFRFFQSYNRAKYDDCVEDENTERMLMPLTTTSAADTLARLFADFVDH